MRSLKIGTRGSDLALKQTEWVREQLRVADPSLEIEQVVIDTPGDAATAQPIDQSWPVGAFVSALERALLAERIDVAVHSYKDLPTVPTAGLSIAAVPVREAVHDVLLTTTEMGLDELPSGARIGTSSPRRAAQLKRLGDFEVIPVRGNVPTRIAKLKSRGLDGVILAAAGLRRLGIVHPHWIDLNVETFVPAPGQGALAVQVRTESGTMRHVTVLDDGPSRVCVNAERSFLAEINAGCHTPTGALATFDSAGLSLHARLFSEDHSRDVEGTESGDDPVAIGILLAHRLMTELSQVG
jgi:hydroxymethylbilane synthase